MKKNKIKEENTIYPITTAPIVRNSKVNDKYIEIFNEVLHDNNNKNIAITGTYGTGKSTFIKTYLDKTKMFKEKNITITIGTYIQDVDRSNGNNKIISNKEKILINNIEESILKQLIYRKKAYKFPKSTFIRIEKESTLAILLSGAFVYLVLITILAFYLKIYYLTLKEIINVLGWPLLICLLLISLSFVYLVVFAVANKIKISKIKIGDYEISLSSIKNNTSIFNKYMSEIIYYFQVTKTLMVIFEDMDRFVPDIALTVIQELKELNTILNGCHFVKKNNPIRFIYATKDSLFNSMENKNKFYDYNLSLLPISTTDNAELGLIGLLKSQKVYSDLDPKVIAIVAKYICDMRTLINLVNDYCNFKKIKGTQNYSKLFAMVAYKNLYYDEYDDIFLFKDNNSIIKLFNSIEAKRDYMVNQKNLEIIKCNEDIDSINEDSYVKIRELKESLVRKNETTSGHLITEYILDGKNNSIKSFFEDSFNIDDLFNKSFELKDNYGNRIREEKVFSEFGSKEDFLGKCDNILNSNSKVQVLKNNIAQTETQKEKIITASDIEILKKYKVNSDIDSQTLVYELVENAFITRDYLNYITSPVEFNTENITESLSYNDSQFIMNIRQCNYSFDLELTGFNTILEILRDELSSPYILNYDLLHYLFKSRKWNIVESIFKQFDDVNNIEKDISKFIIHMLKINENYTWNIVEIFLKCKFDMLCLIRAEDSLDDDAQYITKLMLLNPECVDITKEKDFFCHIVEHLFVTNYQYFSNFSANKKMIVSILKLGPRFSDISRFSEGDFKFVYDNNLYSFEPSNIRRINDTSFLNIKEIKKDTEKRLLYIYLSNSIVEFCTEYYLNTTIKIADKTLIKKILFNPMIDIDIKLEICMREKFKLVNIKGLEPDLLTIVAANDHLKVTWNNVFSLLNKIDDTILYDYGTRNINELINKPLSNSMKTEEKLFATNLLLKLLQKGTEKAYEYIAKIGIHKYCFDDVSNLPINGLIFLIENNALELNKEIYDLILKTEFSDVKKYKDIYITNNVNDYKLVKIISDEELNEILKEKCLTIDEKANLIYFFYKKEKRYNETVAYENFKERFIYTFPKHRKLKIHFINRIFNTILLKMEQESIIKSLSKTKTEITFSL